MRPEMETLNVTNEEIRKFRFSELEAASDFKVRQYLGDGGFGNVYKGKLASTDQEVAIKMLSQNSKQGIPAFIAEVEILSNLQHENIVKLIGYCDENDHKLIVYELMPLGSVETYLFGNSAGIRPGTLNWNTRMKIATETAQAVQYLHETVNPPIIHRDLKCSNILLGDGFKVKLSDFGIAILGPTGDQTFVQTEPPILGTLGCCDPSYAKTYQLTLKSDIFSFGVVLLELITGKRCLDETRSDNKKTLIKWAKPLFRDMNIFKAELVDKLLEGKYPMTELQKAVAIVEICVKTEPCDRPNIGSVVKALEEITSQSDQAESSRTS